MGHLGKMDQFVNYANDLKQCDLVLATLFYSRNYIIDLDFLVRHSTAANHLNLFNSVFPSDSQYYLTLSSYYDSLF